MNNNKVKRIQAIHDFIEHQKVSQRWNPQTERNLFLFEKFCQKADPYNEYLTQAMINEWCMQRSTEQNHSCYQRCRVVVRLIKYLQERNLTELTSPDLPKKTSPDYIPHAFTCEELKNFFDYCDSTTLLAKTHYQKARTMVLSTMFRLLYSSGMRTTEVRKLITEDVDLESGVINVNKSKGYDQHYVALHPDMTELLKQYNNAISRIYPDRKYFFPSSKGKGFSSQLLSAEFKRIWKPVNHSTAVPYDLRHNYAIENINSWSMMEYHQKMIYLSMSMGHSNFESTRYYYSLVPGISNLLFEKTNTAFENLVPEVKSNE